MISHEETLNVHFDIMCKLLNSLAFIIFWDNKGWNIVLSGVFLMPKKDVYSVFSFLTQPSKDSTWDCQSKAKAANIETLLQQNE